MTFQDAIVTLGIGRDAPMTVETLQAAFDRYRELMVAARKDGDDSKASHLSQAHEVLKRSKRKFCGCGRRKGYNAEKCPACKIQSSVPLQLLHANGVCYNVPIPPVVSIRSPIRNKLQLLDMVGASIEVKSGRSTINKYLAELKVEGIMRRTSKDTFRVWRTDGKTEEEVNRLVLARQETNEKGRARA